MAEKTIEKAYTIPLRSGWVREPRSKRSNRAIRDIKAFVLKNTKSKQVKISKGVNELIFERGFQKPPGKIKVEISGDLESVQAKLPGEKTEEKAERKSAMSGLRERFGRGGKESRKKELKEKLDKELTKEKLDDIIDKAIKETEAEQDKNMPAKAKKAEDSVEKELEKVEKAEEKTVEKPAENAERKKSEKS